MKQKAQPALPGEFSMNDAAAMVQLLENTPQQMTVAGARNIDALLNRFKLFANKHLAPQAAEKAQEPQSEDPLDERKPRKK